MHLIDDGKTRVKRSKKHLTIKVLSTDAYQELLSMAFMDPAAVTNTESKASHRKGKRMLMTHNPAFFHISRQPTRMAMRRHQINSTHRMNSTSVDNGAWDQLIANAPSLVVIPEAQVEFNECTADFAGGLEEMEYAIYQVARRMVEESMSSSAEESEREIFVACLRAHLFHFIRGHVLYSNCLETTNLWADAKEEPKNVAIYKHSNGREEFRDALRILVRRDHQLPTIWVSAQIKSLSRALLEYLHLNVEFRAQVQLKGGTELGLALLFECALRSRARLFAPSTQMHEIMQYQPGEVFDPEFMEVRGDDGPLLVIPDGRIRRIRLCVHGCLVARLLPRSKSPSGSEKRSNISLETSGLREKEPLYRVLKSKKAIVILE